MGFTCTRVSGTLCKDVSKVIRVGLLLLAEQPIALRCNILRLTGAACAIRTRAAGVKDSTWFQGTGQDEDGL